MKFYSKRALAAVAAAVLLWGAAPALAQTRYVVIEDLYAQTREGWHARYTTPEGQTVAVDVDIAVPRVSGCPIVELVINREVRMDDTVPKVGRNFSRGDGFIESCTGFDYEAKTVEDAGLWFNYQCYPGEEGAQAEDSPLSPEEAGAAALALTRTYFGVDNMRVRGIIGFSRWPDQTADDIYQELPYGPYIVVGEQTFAGIPVLLGGENMRRYFPRSHFYAEIFTPELYRMWGQSLTQTGVLYEDVPLLPWSEIRKAYEELYLSQGKLLEVYSVEFGYQLILLDKGQDNSAGYDGDRARFPEGTFERTYQVRPVWLLRGYEPSQTVIPDDPNWDINGASPVFSPGQVPAYEKLGVNYSVGIAIDAQTGRLVYDYYDMQESDSLEPVLLTWEDVE